MLNRQPEAPKVNHKRVYRVMRNQGLLLPKHTGLPQRPHDGKVITLASDLRWCSDAFEFRCWNGERVFVAVSMDCCDREAIAWNSASRDLDTEDIRDLMAMSIEGRLARPRRPARSSG